MSVSVVAANKKSLVVDYNILANEQQVIAFFLPEAPTEMLKIFDEVCNTLSISLHVLMRDEKEGRKKQASQQGKVTQHTQGSHFSKEK